MTSSTTATISISPVTRAIGAVIDGVDMRGPLDRQRVEQLRQVWLDRGVVFFRDQDVTPEELMAFVAHFGTPIPEPSNAAYGADANAHPVAEGETAPIKGVAERWHADATWLAAPPMATALRMVHLPPVGGDTCWVNVVAAYDALAEPLQRLLDTLTAVHWMMPSLETMGIAPQSDDIEYVHPVVRVHPETGRKAIYVSEGWTRNIVGLPPAQSNLLLALVFDHVRSPDFNMRWRWAPGDVALWDNRSVQHFAVADYDEGRRIQRVVLAGDQPYGPAQVRS
jgi:alpha-ketoglutarate-dependent taurine dioxygenase